VKIDISIDDTRTSSKKERRKAAAFTSKLYIRSSDNSLKTLYKAEKFHPLVGLEQIRTSFFNTTTGQSTFLETFAMHQRRVKSKV